LLVVSQIDILRFLAKVGFGSLFESSTYSEQSSGPTSSDLDTLAKKKDTTSTSGKDVQMQTS
jgi:hypothetical protein